MKIVSVAYPLPLDRAYDYEAPEGLGESVLPGMRTRAPFGPRASMIGFALSVREGAAGRDLRPLSGLVDGAPLLTAEHIELSRWLSRRYCAPIGECLKIMIPANLRDARRPIKELAAEAPAPVPLPPMPERRFELTAAQSRALGLLTEAVLSRKTSAHLLYGVPASGKTEVYARLIREAVKDGGQALFLVPEISLTGPFFSEFGASVGLPMDLWHSKVGAKKRREVWTGLRSGRVRVVVGARSACLLPFSDLRLAVLDEEQDESYKQDDQAPYYHARDVVIERARRFGATVVLGSATPSIEVFSRSEAGGFGLIRMDERVSKTTGRPPVRILERVSAEGRSIGDELMAGIRTRLEKGEQVILIVNRRGFSNFIMCRKCGWVARCPSCSVALIHHKSQRRVDPGSLFQDAGGEYCLRCHHCDRSAEVPAACLRCKGGPLRLAGFGTQRVVSDLKAMLPSARVMRLDRDTAEADKKSEEKIYDRFLAGKADVLVGTKLAAKGFHFPRVTLVGIVDADTMLNMPDFRAAERTVQLLIQAGGRAGRADRPGEMLLQTAQPTHYAIQAVARGDYASFARHEIGVRKDFHYPPASTLIRIVLSGKVEKSVAKAAEEAGLLLRASVDPSDEVVGPAPGVHAMLHKNFRHHLLVKIKSENRVQAALDLIRGMKTPSTVRVKVNVDPYDFF